MKKISIYTQSFVLSAAVLVCTYYAQAQTNIFPSTGSAGIGTITPNASSILEMVSTSKGLLVPRMTRNQRDSIAKPATGLLIYQTNSTPGFYYYTGTAWKATTLKPAWSLTGNAGTNPATNFIGTTDAQPLVFKVNNQKSGYIGYLSYGDGNTGFGYQTLNAVTSGSFNTANGYQALYSNTTGVYNTAIGAGALYSDTSGYANTAIGESALDHNISGNSNTAIGFGSLAANINGERNTATGFGALYLSTASNNTAYGYDALYHNTTGDGNNANGNEALFFNTTGYYNTATGFQSLFYDTTGSFNTANGLQAMFYNTTGNNNVAEGIRALFSNVTGTDNTAVGDSALYKNTTNATTAVGSKAGFNNTKGTENSYWGTQAGYANSSGSYNNYLGYMAGHNATGNSNNFLGANTGANTLSGSYNTFIGDVAGKSNTGTGNTYIGAGSGGTAANKNSTAIGLNAIATASDQVMLGSTSITSVIAAGSFVIFSDGRFKKNVKDNVPGLSFISQLKPVTYNYDVHGLNTHINGNSTNNNNIRASDASKQQNEDAINAKEKIKYTGFIAQDVEAAAKKLNYDFSGVYKPQNEHDAYGLSYADFVVPLVKAVQELSSQNDSLKQNNQSLKNKLNFLSDKINQIENAMRQCCSSFSSDRQSAITNQSSVKKSGAAALEQNVPNPFNKSTSIPYTLPSKSSSAQIIITDYSGKVLKQINISKAGKGILNVDAGLLTSAAYNYSLFVDGKIIDTKRMVLAK